MTRRRPAAAAWLLLLLGGPGALGQDECATGGDATCAAAVPPQTCDDPNPANAGDWVCLCTPPATGPQGPQGAAQGCLLNECAATCPTCVASTCSSVGQACDDTAGPGENELGDWFCECVGPRDGRAMRAAATCTIDECVATCNTCAGTSCTGATPAQTCRDPNDAAGPVTTSLYDWVCECTGIRTGTKEAQRADCELDECDAACMATDCPGATCCAGTTCASAPLSAQDCEDPSPADTSLNDWVCKCAGGRVGEAEAAQAACEMDECTVTSATWAGTTCSAATQDCEDRGALETETNDWWCLCRAPLSGEAMTAAVVTCELDECTADKALCGSCAGTTCSDKGQGCTDTDKAVGATMTWECRCNPPGVGVQANAFVAACSLDECTEMDPACTTCAKGACGTDQDCGDPDPTTASLDDWECACRAPTTGTGLRALAACVIDECLETCTTCAMNACSGAAPVQDCRDADQRAELAGRSNWECTCRAPSVGAQTNGRASCALNECTASPCATCEMDQCEGIGQTCTDMVQTDQVLGDWECACRAPFVGTATAAAATCELDECTAVCATCEQDACKGGATPQTCDDPNKSPASTLDWKCQCTAPSTGTGDAALAACVLNECTAACGTCDTASLCAGSAQDCVDPDDDPLSHGDWECVCRSPEQGAAQMAVASCVLDECDARCTAAHCAGTTCTDALQTCRDTDNSTTSVGDWFCECAFPTEGSRRTLPAACTLDECVATCGTCAGGACAAAVPPQICEDTDKSVTGAGIRSWECICDAPSAGRERAAQAACKVDECTVAKDADCPTCEGDVCTIGKLGIPQECVDAMDDAGSLGDWECRCYDPYVGAAMTTAADCVLDECAAMCGTCAKGKCADYDQTCDDPDTGPMTLSDWECHCKPPRVGHDQAQVAVCVLDECTAACPTCADRMCSSQHPPQNCEDPDTNGGPFDEAYSDWLCTCIAPLVGTRETLPAQCEIDECEAACDSCENDLCRNHTQDCLDPDLSADSQHDWRCECAAPYKGFARGREARCEIDECGTDSCRTCANVTCSSAGQDCVEPDWEVMFDWECHCKDALVGTAVAAAAQCMLDECANLCTTCAGTQCSDAQQICEDLDKRVESRYDWVCRCAEPTHGEERGAVATCYLNECNETSGRCTTCAFSECTSYGQGCVDPDHDSASTYDWACTCPPPTHGSQEAAHVETCWLDECDRNSGCSTCANDTCFDAAQACEDLNLIAASTGDWVCECHAPLSGHAFGRPVVELNDCFLDECTAACQTCAGNTCSAAGQDCDDPSTHSHANVTNDWFCVCRAPLVGRAQAAAVAQCLDADSPEYTASPEFKASPVYLDSPTYDASPLHKDTPLYEYEQSPAWRATPQYKDSPGYDAAPAWLASPQYRDTPRYDGSPAFKDTPEHRASPEYLDSPTFKNTSEYRGTPRFKDSPAYLDAPAYKDTPEHDASPRYLASPSYKDTPEHKTSPEYVASPAYKDTPVYDHSPAFKDTPEFREKPAYKDSPTYLDSPQYKSVPQYLASPTYVSSPGYFASPEGVGAPGWKATPGYDEAPQYKDTPRYLNSPRYLDTPRYRASPAYVDSPEFLDSPDGRATPRYRDAPVYDASPGYQASPQHRAYMASPEYKATPRYISSPAAKHLDSPEFKTTPEYLDTPDGRVWLAAWNREAGVAESHRDPLTYAAAGALGGSLLMGSAFAGAAATHVAAVAAPCTQNGEYRPLPRPLHPTGLTVAGDPAMGVVVGNTLILAAVTWLFAVFNYVCCRRQSDEQAPHDWAPRLPSPVLFVFALLHTSFTASGGSLLLYPDNAGFAAAGAMVLILALAVPIAVAAKVSKSVPAHGVYKHDPAPPSCATQFLSGPGEWVSTAPHLYFVTEYASMIRSFTTESVWFVSVGFFTTGGLGLALALRPGSWQACGNVMAAKAFFLLVYTTATLLRVPHAKARDTAALGLAAFLCAGAAGMMAVGYYKEDPDFETFDYAGYLLWASVAVVAIKVVLDMLSEAAVYCTRRRTRLENGDRAHAADLTRGIGGSSLQNDSIDDTYSPRLLMEATAQSRVMDGCEEPPPPPPAPAALGSMASHGSTYIPNDLSHYAPPPRTASPPPHVQAGVGRGGAPAAAVGSSGMLNPIQPQAVNTLHAHPSVQSMYHGQPAVPAGYSYPVHMADRSRRAAALSGASAASFEEPAVLDPTKQAPSTAPTYADFIKTGAVSSAHFAKMHGLTPLAGGGGAAQPPRRGGNRKFEPPVESSI